MTTRHLLAGTALTTALFLVPGIAHAQFIVTNNNDSGAGSFRQAILDATAAPGSTITFSAGVGTITLLSDLPALTVNTTINANGATLSGNNLFRGLFAYSGNTSISNLTITNALAQGGAGG
ncbi:hypothetical protein [Bradyrhizobium sp. AS23.2]|uniref:hypothetical protein n=1 Tax=Bradyrhizobium sp. AS23.2 TaxID=1680155 RepID=UPI00093B0DFC|nr:hypothetical protein [Bradyrhizobium sp. AS23.2]OKO67325.1 hypothetical protein AC630_40445 [Bradyrhizobium sp. AS23.2]